MLQNSMLLQSWHYTVEYRNMLLDLGQITDSAKQFSKLAALYREDRGAAWLI